MTTTALPPALSATAAGTATPQADGSVRRALARTEGRRLVGHPLFVLGMLFSALFAIVGASEGGGLSAVVGGVFLFVGAGIWTFLVACLAASRERRDGAQDFYGGQPVTARLRTEAALLSVAWAALAGGALIAVATAAIAGPDLALTVEGERYALRPLELLQGPAYVLFVGAMGVLVGVWSRRTYPALIGALVMFMPPVAWLPWFVYGDDVPPGVWDDWLAGASVAWHLVGIAGLTALAAAGALARHDRRPRIALLALVALGAAVVGIALGWPPEM